MNLRAQNKRILVTGGAGFIGSHLVEHLLDEGSIVTVVDNLSTGRIENLDRANAAAGDRLTFIESDLDAALIDLERGSFDEVYHLAAAVGVRLVIERPIHTIRTNVLDTLALLEYVRPSQTRVLLASTSEVYGKSTKTPFAEEDDVVYGPTVYSRWSYACSKAIDEYLGLAYAHEHGVPIVIARFFNTVGPRQVGQYGMVIPRFVSAALAGRPIEVHGDGKQSRCFCDVRDVVGVLPVLMRSSANHGRVINVGHDEPIEIGNLAAVVKSTLGSDSEIKLVPYETALGPGFDDLRHRQPDLTRLREATGFAAKIPLEQTILDLAAELRSRASQKLESGAP